MSYVRSCSKLVALDVIARDDARGLERMILSARSSVDEIIVGVDGRSDIETRRVAEWYADVVWVFDAKSVGLSDEEWANNKMHFANTRNLGRAKVTAPWTLYLDSDEYIEISDDLRALVSAVGTDVDTFEVVVSCKGLRQRDVQRLARSSLRFRSAMHNQLVFSGATRSSKVVVVCDDLLRSAEFAACRKRQREIGLRGLAQDARRGDLSAMRHVALAKIGEAGDNATKLDAAVEAVQMYHLCTRNRDPYSGARAFLALGLAACYCNAGDFDQARRWCLLALYDGPRREALCVLGDMAEVEGALKAACTWYETACATAVAAGGMTWPEMDAARWDRLAKLRRALGAPLPLSIAVKGLMLRWRVAGDHEHADALAKLLDETHSLSSSSDVSTSSNSGAEPGESDPAP